MCNANYEFTLLDIGDADRQSDDGVYKNSNLGYAIDHNTLKIPLPATINNSSKLYPYVFVADEAFQLKPFLLKSFSRLHANISRNAFNYHLSRARRLIENRFVIATAKFRILRRPNIAKVDNVIAITKAVTALHNFLMISQNKFNDKGYCPPGLIDDEMPQGHIKFGEWRNEVQGNTGFLPLTPIGFNNYSRLAKDVRDDFMGYCTPREGEISWQWNYINRTHDPFDEI